MATKFVLRGSALTAYKHSGGGKAAVTYAPATTIPALVTDAGAIGGQAINYDTGQTAIRGHNFPGFDNCSKNQAQSILHRFAPRYSGTPSQNQSIISIAGPSFLANLLSLGIQIYHNTSGNLLVTANNTRGQVILTANTNMGAWSPTSGQYYDFCIVWDGTTGTNAFKFYIDGTLFYQATPSRAWATDSKDFIQSSIMLGVGHRGIQFGDYYTNEFIIWDETIDPTSSGLNLNGSSRSSYVSITGTLDPTDSSDPGEANVRSATAYTINGVAKTGTAAIPSAANVRQGTAVDATTGTLNLPAEANVKSGITFDGATKTGTLVSTDPGEANVASGVSYTIESVAKLGTRAVVTNVLSDAVLTGQSLEATLIGGEND